MTTDKFIHNAEGFLEVNYNTVQGDLRIQLLLEDLEKVISERPSIHTILDIGAGHAPVTLQLLKKYPRLTALLTDPSEALLTNAQKYAANIGVNADQFSIRRASLDEVQATKDIDQSSYDLIICHVVANWASDPDDFILHLSKFLHNPNQVISLAIGTVIGHEFKYATMGNLELLSKCVNDREGLLPSLTYGNDQHVRLLDPVRIVDLLESNGYAVLKKAAIKIFSEHLPHAALTSPQQVEQITEIERSVRHHSQYWMLGNLAHIVYARTAE